MPDPRPPVLPRAVLDAMQGGVAQVDRQGEIVGVNAAWQTLAATRRLLPGTNVTLGSNYLSACEGAAAQGNVSAGEAAAVLRAVLAGRSEPASIEFEVREPATTRWCEVVIAPLAGDGFEGALITQVDVTARRASAETLLRSEAQYRAIVERAPVGIYLATEDGRIVAANQCLADIVGARAPAELIGTRIQRFYARPIEPESRIDPPTPGASIEIEWKREDGVPIWVQMAARVVGDPGGQTVWWEGFVYDISERKRLEAQLVQAQKMESVGRLAGGIAHDFNNLLTVMIGYAELLHGSADLPAGFRIAVREILAAARRAAELTGRMLAFARKQRVEPRVVNVNDVVRGVERLLHRIIGEDVRLDVRLDREIAPVLIDPAQLEQVLMNLAVNARDAMPQGGSLVISTGTVDISEEEVRRRPGLRPGRQVRIAMADTGIGMDAETLARIFEPFFTTKEPGKGTGLGLAMCYGIIKQANGFIGCQSEQGVGTTCTVLLPVATDAPEPETAAIRPPDTASRPTTAATILVVEDEPVVRRFVAQVLQEAGHVVRAAGTPAEGLAMAAEPGVRFDLLVTDVVMPQMDGITLAERIRAHLPTLRVLLVSGYQDPRVSIDGRASLLPKPFTAGQLRAIVEDLLRIDGGESR